MDEIIEGFLKLTFKGSYKLISYLWNKEKAREHSERTMESFRYYINKK